MFKHLLKSLSPQQHLNEAGDADGGGESPPTAGGPAPDVAPSAPPQAPPPPASSSSTAKLSAQEKADERERGRKAALGEMDRKAKKLGYKSMQHMLERQAEERSRRREQPSPRPKEREPAAAAPPAAAEPLAGTRAARREQLEKERLIEDRRRANKSRATEEKRRVAAEETLRAREAEYELKLAAVRAGIKDPDYAVVLCQRHARGLPTEAQQEAFDEAEFFGVTLKKTHPYLYGVEERPAHTDPGTSPGERGAPPKPGAEPKAPTPNGKSARNMSHEEYQAVLAKNGLTNPQLGIVSGGGGGR